MTIDFKTFDQIAHFITTAQHPIMLRGAHGIGKSSVVYQLAAKLGLPVIERRVSQMTEGDLLGLPYVENDQTEFKPMEWLKVASEQPVILFFDELDRGEKQVRQGIMELTDSRKLHGIAVHPNTLFFAAVNGGEHGAQYEVADFDPAELDRWTVFDIEPTVEDWLTWANGLVDKMIIEFIRNTPTHLEHKGELEPNKIYPSRRSWQRFSIATTSILATEGNSGVLFHLASGYLGMEAAVAFVDFYDNYERQIKVADILNGHADHKLANLTTAQHNALIDSMVEGNNLVEKLNETQLTNLAKWFFIMPSELSMHFWTKVTSCGNHENIIKFHGTKVGNHTVKEHIVVMCNKETK